MRRLLAAGTLLLVLVASTSEASAVPPPSLGSLALRAASVVGVELAAQGLRDRARQGVFPIAGPHDLGRSPANRFGGGRGHKGQDMFAACGTPVVAAGRGRVLHVADEGRAGNYLVVERPDRRSEVYMHLRRLPRLAVGARVAAGERVGAVGDTGDADGCHLHFELWTAPGWYRGGRPVDPLPMLNRLP